MRDTNLLTDVKLAGASALATTLFAIFVPGSPLWAAELVFSSASEAVSGQNGNGEQQIASGIVQIKLDDGTMVSIMGPARYSLSTDGQLSVSSGSFTASAPAGASPKPIIAGSGSQVTLKSGSSANGKIAADGSFSGFALTGSLQVASNGATREFPAGRAFRSGNGAGPSSTITAGVQPNRSVSATPLQQILKAQRNAAQFLANGGSTTPTSIGFAGVSQTQNFVPGTLQAATTPAQFQTLVKAQTGKLDSAVALQFITDILAALQTTGGLGSYSDLTPAQIQAFLFNLQTFGAPAGISQFQLEQFLRALGNAGFTVTGISGQGPNFGSLADLLALVAAGGTIPPGDPTIQALVDLLFANPFPPGLDVDEIAQLFRLAGYTVPSQFGGGTGGTPTPGPTPTPTPTPTPPPVLAGSDGVRPDGSRTDINLAFAKITETGQDSAVTLIFEGDEFVGYRMRSGFEIRFGDRDEGEKGGDKGIIGWSRLVGGTKALGARRGPDSGDHFVFGIPMINAPSGGLLNYDLIGYTSPTMRDDSVAPGGFSGKFSVSFGTARILAGLEATITMSDSVYDVQSAGGVLAPSISVLSDGRFNGTIDIEDGLGIACKIGDCRFIYNGFLAGEGASHAGFAYTIRDDAPNVFKWIDGSAAFAKGDNDGGTPNPITKTFRGVTINNSFAQPVAGDFSSALQVSANFLTRGEIRADEGRAFRIAGYVDGNSANKSALSLVRVDGGIGDSNRDIGTAKNADHGALGDVLGWTRWIDGEFDNLKGGKRVLAGSESIHYIYGDGTSGTLPTGRAEYAVGGGTRPTRVDGQGDPGTFEGEIAIDFATLKMGWDTIIGMGNDRFNFLSTGGLDDLSIDVMYAGNGIYNFASDGTVISELGRCDGCTGTASGFLSGEDGRYVGFSYEIGTVDFGAIHGVAGFEQVTTGSLPPSGTVRDNQYVVYAAGNNIGIDSRTPRPSQNPPLPLAVAYSGSGAPIAYQWSASESPTIGTAKEFESGSVGDIIGWTRWADGTTGGTFYSSPEKIFGANQGWHILAGTPVINIPTSGSVAYELVGATAPTIRDGSLTPGSFSGNLAVAFSATPMVGFDFAVEIGGSSYSFGTPSGSSDPGNGGRPIETSGDFAFTFFGNDLPVTGTGPICSGSGACNASMRGFLVGDAASHVGVSYTFGNGSFDQRVDGVAAFGIPGFSPSVSGFDNWSGWTADSNVAGSRAGFAPAARVRLEHPGLLSAESIKNFRDKLGPNFSFQ